MFRNTRTPLACARCYKRKKRCDLKYPSCTQCTKARVQCIGLDRDSQAELPRSLVTYLQTLVDELEVEKGNLSTDFGRHDEGVNLNQEIPQQEHVTLGAPELRRSPIACALAATTVQGGPSMFSAGMQAPRAVPLPYYKSFFMGAELPYPLAFQTQRSINFVCNPQNPGEPTNLPEEVVEKLMAVYTERILPQYPLFLKEEIFGFFQSFRNGTATEDEQFIVLMVQAITTASSKSRDYRKSVSLAESLRRDAFNCLDFGLNCNRPATATIQKLLLLAQYGFLLPSSTNLWQVVGDAMRIALELGLHLDTPARAGLDDKVVEFRKRLFWTLYSIERSVAIASHRPYAVSGDDIHVIFPALEEEPTANDSSRVLLIDRLYFLRLQAEICSVNIGMRPIPTAGFTYEDWMASTQQRIFEIKAQSVVSQEGDYLEWQSVLLLHMPCRRNPTPDESSVMSCFEAAVQLANAYGELAQLKDIENPWHATHHCYEAGNLILYSLWYYAPLVRENYTIKQIFDVVHQISGFFILIAKQWPAAQQCGALFDGLRKGALSFFREEASSDIELGLEAKQLKDLVLRENADFLYALDQCHPEHSILVNALPNFGLEDISPLGFTSDLEYLDFFNFPETPALEGLGSVFMEDVAQETEFLQAPDIVHIPDVAVSNVSATHNIDDAQFRTALSKLPVCSHCKKRRIKCDVDLPACRSCTKLHRECFFWDTALSQQTSRKRIQVLKEKVESLMEELKASNSLAVNSGSVPPDIQSSSITADMSLPSNIVSSLLLGPHNDESTSSDMLFFGTTSAFARLAPEPRSSLPAPSELESCGHKPSKLVETILGSLALSIAKPVPKKIAEELSSLYYQSIELCYPILGQDLLQSTVNSVYDSHFVGEDGQICRIRLSLVLAISLALLSYQDDRLRGAADTYFHEAITSGISVDAFVRPTNTDLQLVLLLCVYAWVCPQALDIWRLIGHASRMCLDMVEVHGSDKTDSATTGKLHRTLYTLESRLAIAFGRPRHLPDGTDVSTWSPSSVQAVGGELPTLVYDLVRLQNRFHKDMIKRETDLFGLIAIDSRILDFTWMSACVYDVKGWLERWNAHVDSYFINSDAVGQEMNSAQLLKLWGQFQQCRSLLLAKMATDRRGQFLISADDELDIYKQMIKAGKGLLEQWLANDLTSNSAILPSFPPTWTFIHDVFNALIILLQQPRCLRSVMDTEVHDLFEDGLEVLEVAGKSGIQGITGLLTFLKSLG